MTTREAINALLAGAVLGLSVHEIAALCDTTQGYACEVLSIMRRAGEVGYVARGSAARWFSAAHLPDARARRDALMAERRSRRMITRRRSAALRRLKAEESASLPAVRRIIQAATAPPLPKPGPASVFEVALWA